MKIADLMKEQGEWQERNFGRQPANNLYFGIMEEVGELCHAHLKGKQGIRHSPEQILAMKQDAVGDIVIYVMGFHSAARVPWSGEDYLSVYDKTAGHYLLEPDEALEDIVLKASLQHWDGLLYFLAHYAQKHGFTLETAVTSAWNEVKQRDWMARTGTEEMELPA